MENDFRYLLEQFVELGGTAENICLRKGELGRGIFPLDSLRRAKIFSPKDLFIDRDDVCISRDEIYVKDSGRFSSKQKNSSKLTIIMLGKVVEMTALLNS